jgi:hypothetical protein
LDDEVTPSRNFVVSNLHVGVRFTPADLQRLEDAARAAGVKMSEYIRCAVAEKHGRPTTPVASLADGIAALQKERVALREERLSLEQRMAVVIRALEKKIDRLPDSHPAQ